MNNAKLLLQKLTILIPPGEDQRHNLTVNEDGNLMLGLMLGDVFQYLMLEDEDFLKSADSLANEICRAVKVSD
jgi:hypothetical protein